MKKTKKITRKGCRNVQLVWHEPYFSGDFVDFDEGDWVVEKIHKDKPATFVTKQEVCVDGFRVYKRAFMRTIHSFPYLPRMHR